VEYPSPAALSPGISVQVDRTGDQYHASLVEFLRLAVLTGHTGIGPKYGVLSECWWQWAKGPKWQTTRTTLPLVDGGGNITRLAVWRASELTLCELSLQGKVQKRIVRAAARGNAGSGCCQRKDRHNPAKMAPFFAATDS
jgi:hypothetical protein